jgi:opacity protein-like surface antigen
MKKLATLVAGLLFVCGVANAADYSANTQINLKNGPYGRAAGDYHEIEWEVVNGYMALGDNTTFTFDVDKYFYELKDDESFDVELGITQRLPSTEMMGKTFSNEVSLKYNVEQQADEEDKDTTKLVYVTGTDFAGVSTSLELIGAMAEDKDTYEANVYLGKGLGDYFSLSVEAKNAINPDESDDADYEFALNTFLNYNYDLGMGLKFNTECAFKTESEFEATTAYVAPQLKYSYAVNEETTFYTGVVYEALKYTTTDLGDEDFDKVDGEGKVYLGFNYTR